MRLSERIQNGNTSSFLKSLNEGCEEKKEELKEERKYRNPASDPKAEEEFVHIKYVNNEDKEDNECKDKEHCEDNECKDKEHCEDKECKDDKEEVNESLEQNDGDGWGEDIKEICEPFFEKVEQTMYEVRNCVRGSYAHFGDTVLDLAAWMGELANEAEAVQSELDNMKEQLQEDNTEECDTKLEEKYVESFGGDTEDFMKEVEVIKAKLEEINTDDFGAKLSQQMVDDWIEACDRLIEKANRLDSEDEFDTKK